MTVTIVMHGTLRRFLPDGSARATIDVADGSTVADALAGLGAEKDTWLVARNQAVAERDTVLEPGDVIDCFEPVAGGSSRRGPSSPPSLPPTPDCAGAADARTRNVSLAPGGAPSQRRFQCPFAT